MRNCDINIGKLREDNDQRAREIERKRKQFEILQSKKKRIEQQKQAVEKYQNFLEEVKSQNNDEFTEVTEISARYRTLSKLQEDLSKKKEGLDRQLEEKKTEVSNFERGMEAKVMSLGNQIANLTIECDQVDAMKNALQNDSAETSAKKIQQESELAQVIFAIEMIENLCSKKTETHDSGLPYPKISVKQASFDTITQCEDTAIA